MINTLGMGTVLLCHNADFLSFLLCGALISEPVFIWFFNACDFKNTQCRFSAVQLRKHVIFIYTLYTQ